MTMKRSSLLLAISTLLFSFLFYQQKAGINFFLFSILIVAILAIDDSKRLKDKYWLIFALLSIISGFFVGVHGTVASVLANITALSVLACRTFLPKVSFFTSVIFAFFSYISSFIYLIIDLTNKSNSAKSSKNDAVNTTDKSEVKKARLDLGAKIIIGIIILVVLIVFISLYRKASPVFKEFTNNINLDFISYNWIVFTFWGFLLMYGFFFIRYDKKTYENDINAPYRLAAEGNNIKNSSFLGISMDIQSEATVIMIFLGLLNLLLFLLNVIDISFMASGGNLPTDVTYSDYVHKGVGTLIISVILVIAIVMYFFRGAINFYKNSSVLRLLANIWLVQNLILLVATAFRNAIYISEYDLTYKRIGVYVWLFLTAFGLLTTIYKVVKKCSSWFLIRINGWAFFVAILFLGTVNWDVVIAKYNTRNLSEFDYEYISRLNDNALPTLNNALKMMPVDDDTTYFSDKKIDSFNAYHTKIGVELRIMFFKSEYERGSWKSWNYDDWVTYNELK